MRAALCFLQCAFPHPAPKDAGLYRCVGDIGHAVHGMTRTAASRAPGVLRAIGSPLSRTVGVALMVLSTDWVESAIQSV